MPICTRCGERSPDGAVSCNKCGIAFGVQFRANAAAKKAQTGLIVRVAAWLVTVVVLIVVAPPAYHAALGAYLKHHLQSVTESANKDCSGPVTASTPAYQKDQINKCLATNEDLTKAQSDYATFTKNAKR